MGGMPPSPLGAHFAVGPVFVSLTPNLQHPRWLQQNELIPPPHTPICELSLFVPWSSTSILLLRPQTLTAEEGQVCLLALYDLFPDNHRSNLYLVVPQFLLLLSWRSLHANRARTPVLYYLVYIVTELTTVTTISNICWVWQIKSTMFRT